jgi:2-keto-3-deoxy-L-rhamnonate aldolase RhmA
VCYTTIPRYLQQQALGIKFITSPEIIYIARNAGFHALFIDLEHSSLSLETASHLCVTGMNVCLSPIVRVPGQAGPGFIQWVLDNGAQGVIVPHVDIVGASSPPNPNQCQCDTNGRKRG